MCLCFVKIIGEGEVKRVKRSFARLTLEPALKMVGKPVSTRSLFTLYSLRGNIRVLKTQEKKQKEINNILYNNI